MEMSELKKKLLQIIEKNSRIAIDELAIMLGVPEIEAAGALQAMEEEGIICGYHTMIDWSKTDIEKVNALIEVKVTPQRGLGFDSIAERLPLLSVADAVCVRLPEVVPYLKPTAVGVLLAPE